MLILAVIFFIEAVHALLLWLQLEILEMNSLVDTPSAVPNAAVLWAESDDIKTAISQRNLWKNRTFSFIISCC